MATLALAAAGAAAGSALLPAGVTALGVTLTGAQIGAQLGASAGSYIDDALFGSSGKSRTVEGPRLADLHVTTSTEGAPIPRAYGSVRVGSQIFWAAPIREEVVVSSRDSGTSGGKGIGGSGRSSANKTVEYRYYATFAAALCEGKISALGRVWVDGEELDLSQVTHRLYVGDETQPADSAMTAREGVANTPAYRGLAYVVFEDLPLANYGNRIPQLSFELFRAVEEDPHQRGVVLIPGSGEFVYGPDEVSEILRPGATRSTNVHTRQGATDWTVSLNQLEATLPNCKSVSLVVSWFGTDLRAPYCQIRPGVDSADKNTTPVAWSVAGETRNQAYLVSTKDGRAAYGGTPSDAAVVAAIRDLRSRGLKVTLNPFILMDVAENNALTNPYGGTVGQAIYPWRGRITLSLAPGTPGSPDQTAPAATEVAAFVGNAQPSHFSLQGDSVVYSGPPEWSLRRMILHYAYLAKAAGGVDGFLLLSELRGLTTVRSSPDDYPFVDALVQLAADVKTILGANTLVSYGADWSEYFGHQPTDGSGDVYFHLDPLWASNNIDAVAIDLYWPLSDWRDGREHADYGAGYRSIYDLAYLRANIAGGEGYDWYYQDEDARTSQIRTPITDGLGKPWMFRYKDIKSWWENQHFNRPAGIESSQPTAWVPQSKPFWISELGCPAVDKGSNQPNVFVDPKSSESKFPYFSRESRDDLIQRRFIKAFLEAFDPASDGYVDGLNPISSATGKRMVDIDHIYVYAWDTRPYPAFPQNTAVWSDGENWRLGHWLNGRYEAAHLSELVQKILQDYDFDAGDASALNGTVPGYVIDRVMSARDAIGPLELAFFFDALESEDRIAFRHRGAMPSVMTAAPSGLVEKGANQPLLTLTRGQETDLPASAKVMFIAQQNHYHKAVAEARRISGASGRISQAELPIVLDFEQASEIAESWLYETWTARENAKFILPPSALHLEPGDVLTISHNNEPHAFRIVEIEDHTARTIEARSIDHHVYAGVVPPTRTREDTTTPFSGTPVAELLDLPLLTGSEDPETGYFAAYQDPWPGGVALFSSPEDTGYVFRTRTPAPAVIGTTTHTLNAGPGSRLNKGARLTIEVFGGSLTSTTHLQMLAGRNSAALKNSSGIWEVIQFETATLVGTRTYELSNILRGQAGTEYAIEQSLAPGAVFVLLGTDVATIALGAQERNLPLNWRYGPSARDVSDQSYSNLQHAFTGRAWNPLAPVHIKAAWSNGDLTISWIRRTRSGGDGWDAADVPLGEAEERYEVDILNGGSVLRTLTATMPSAIYTAAQIAEDFVTQPSSISVAIYQISNVCGRGTPATAVL